MEFKANVNLHTKPGTLKGFASVTINDEFVIKGLRIYEGDNGPFLAIPSRKIGMEYDDICFPITAECRENLHNTVLEAYEQKLEQQKEQKNEKTQTNQKNRKGQSASKSQKSNNELKKNTDETEMSEDGQDEQVGNEPEMQM